jgi:uncharacterized protein YlxW (UPF0749 family)
MDMPSARARSTVILTIISMVLGFMLAIQYRVTQQTSSSVEILSSNQNTKQTLEELKVIQDTNKQLETKLSELEQQIVQYEKQSGAMNENLRKELENARILAATVPVQGPGIQLTISDSDMNRVPNSGDPEKEIPRIIHDVDINRVVNELFLAGAEAVAVNGIRVATTRSIVCIGPVVKVNDQTTTVPVKIEAIGNPQQLITALTMRAGVLDYLRGPDRQLTVVPPKEVPLLKLPAYTGDFNRLSKNEDGG